jgi:transposase
MLGVDRGTVSDWLDAYHEGLDGLADDARPGQRTTRRCFTV